MGCGETERGFFIALISRPYQFNWLTATFTLGDAGLVGLTPAAVDRNPTFAAGDILLHQ
jgi:hypothetical protein